MANFFGTAGNDTLTGGAGDDTLLGLAGLDLLYGGSGLDFLSGAAGNDTLNGGLGADILVGGYGNDLYDGVETIDQVVEGAQGGFDVIRSGALRSLANLIHVEGLVWTGTAAAALTGNAASNRLTGGVGNDTLNGGAGHDTLEGAGGADRLVGGSGDDRYLWTTGDTIIEGAGGGFDTAEGLLTSLAGITGVEALIHTGTSGAAITGTTADDWLRGGSGNDTLSGQSGNDVLVGGAGTDSVLGSSGNDTLSGGATLAGADFRLDLGDGRSDILNGGAGNDVFHVFDTGDRAVETATSGSRDIVYVHGPQWSGAQSPFVEGIVVQSTGSVVTGTTRNDTILGGSGSDLLDGGSGNDTIAGGWTQTLTPAGSDGDTLVGGAGDDVLIALRGYTAADDADTAVFGGSGNDLYVLSDGGIYTGVDSAGFDQVVLAGPYSPQTVDLSGLLGIEVINMSGGTGPASALNPQPFAAASAAIIATAALAGQTIVAFPLDPAPQNLVANSDGTLIYGNVFNNEIDARGGNDTVVGAGGEDTIFGGDGDDLIFAQLTNVLVQTNESSNVLDGGAGADRLVAGAFFETPSDPAQTRGDTLTGGSDADRFEVRTVTLQNGAVEVAPGSGFFSFRTGHLVTDFQTGEDEFVFDAALIGNGDAVVDNAEVRQSAGGFSADAELVILRGDVVTGVTGDLRLADAAAIIAAIGSATSNYQVGQTAVFVVDDGTSSAAFVFQSADGNSAVTADELYLLAVFDGVTNLSATDISLELFS